MLALSFSEKRGPLYVAFFQLIELYYLYFIIQTNYIMKNKLIQWLKKESVLVIDFENNDHRIGWIWLFLIILKLIL